MRQTYGSMCVVAGLLLTVALAPAQAQTPSGAKETITIKSEAEKQGTPAQAAPAAANPALGRPQPGRDPFVQGSVTGNSSVGVKKDAKLVKAKQVGGKDAAAAGTTGKSAQAEVEVAPPQVTVNGIVLSYSGNRAILVSPNQTYIVKTGDKLGDYRVSEIGNKHVTFKYKDKAFKLKMDDEFSAKK